MLKEVLSEIIGEKQRQFLLLRIVGIECTPALNTLQVPIGTYKNWVRQKKFQEVYRQVNDLGAENRDEALMMLRNTNYALVVQLEENMLKKMIEEVESGQPKFVKTNLAREIYAKLASEMSTKPNSVRNVMTWEQLIMAGESGKLPQGEQPYGYIEAEVSKTQESPESEPEEDNLQQDIPCS